MSAHYYWLTDALLLHPSEAATLSDQGGHYDSGNILPDLVADVSTIFQPGFGHFLHPWSLAEPSFAKSAWQGFL